MKVTLKNINDLIGNKFQNKITEILNNNIKVTDHNQISELCNNYFAFYLASELQSMIPTP